MGPGDKLRDLCLSIRFTPHSKRWKGGPGQVVLNASEADREQFRSLKSNHVANFVDNELAAQLTMSEHDERVVRFKREVRRLLAMFDEEIAKYRKIDLGT